MQYKPVRGDSVNNAEDEVSEDQENKEFKFATKEQLTNKAR